MRPVGKPLATDKVGVTTAITRQRSGTLGQATGEYFTVVCNREFRCARFAIRVRRLYSHSQPRALYTTGGRYSGRRGCRN